MRKTPCSNEQGFFVLCGIANFVALLICKQSHDKATFLLQFGVLLQIALFDMLQQYRLQPNAIVVQLEHIKRKCHNAKHSTQKQKDAL